jgi:hypothetical protein
MVPSGDGVERLNCFGGSVDATKIAIITTAARATAVAMGNRFKPAGYSPAPFLSAAALSVRSQVNSGSVRPKCPKAAVFV